MDTGSITTPASQSNVGTYTTVSKNMLKEMNKRLKAEMKKLKEAQEQKLQELEHKLYLDMQLSITTAMECSVENFSGTLKATVDALVKATMAHGLNTAMTTINAANQHHMLNMSTQNQLMMQQMQNNLSKQNKKDNLQLIQQMQATQTMITNLGMGSQKPQASLSSALHDNRNRLLVGPSLLAST
eukprot:8359818-Ditylum_brightwellii.AAC.1